MLQIRCILFAVAAFACISSARAATLVANPEQVDVTRSNNVNQIGLNTLDVTNLPPAAVKIAGDGDFQKTNGSTGTITAQIAGKVTANTTDMYAEHHDFSFTLTGAGQVTWLLEGKVDLGFPFGFQTIFSDSSAQPQSAGTMQYLGNNSGAVPLSLSNANFLAILTVTWTGGASGNTLAINIPNNSIDIAIVPEPGSMVLLGIAGMGLLSRRRR